MEVGLHAQTLAPMGHLLGLETTSHALLSLCMAQSFDTLIKLSIFS